MKVVDDNGLRTMWAAIKTWVTDFVNEKMNDSTAVFISSNEISELPFEHCTFVMGNPNLENGPWYRDGVKVSATNNIHKNDYTNVLNDESVCYGTVRSYRYQRHKDGAFAQGSYGYIVLANNQRSYIRVTPRGQMYFIDDSRMVFTEFDACIFVSSFTQLHNSVKAYEWTGDITTTVAGTLLEEADLFFPTTRYICTAGAEFDEDGKMTKLPVFAFNMIVNDSAMSGEQLAALNSGITSSLVNTFTNYSTSKQDKLTTMNRLDASCVSGLGLVATSDNYNDLVNKPEIPSLDGMASEEFVTDSIAKIHMPVKTSDLYNDIVTTQTITINQDTKEISLLTNEDKYLPVTEVNKLITAYNDLLERVENLESK